MPFITAIAAGGATNIAGSIFGGLFGSSAEKKRAAAINAAGQEGSQAILKAGTAANQQAEKQLGVARGDLSPFRGIGVQAGQTLADLLMGGKSTAALLKESDLFRFQSDIGSRNINRELAARGLYGSGAGLETLQRFNNQLTAEEGQRVTDRLFNLTNLGYGAANNMASLTNNTGIVQSGNILNSATNAANLRYNATVGAAQANSNATQMLGQMGQDIFSSIGQGFQQYGNYQLNKPVFDAFSRSASMTGA